MKRLVLVFVGAALVVGIALWVRERTAQPVPVAVQTAANPNDQSPLADTVISTPPEPPAPRPSTAAGNRSTTAETLKPAPSATEAKPDEAEVFKQTIDWLLSPQAGFQQKQALWALWRTQGKLDQAIAELEQRAASNPTSPECQTTLGEAYIYKIPISQDSRDPAILGLKADQSFDAALKIDPSNWEAGFFKATSMSYWPEALGKSSEVIQRFTDLIQQQETMPPRPEFADSYVRLGEQYKKAGSLDDAKQVWQRGAVLFPDNQSLRQNLASHP